MKILILGGAGFTGPHQVRYAISRGHEVTLFNRGRTALPDDIAHVEQLHGDRAAGDLASLQGRRWDVCIDNPTTLPSWARDAARVLSGKVERYIFVSTVSVYRDLSQPAREDSALHEYEG
jgi:2'-hydroxyisoflavone reductase